MEKSFGRETIQFTVKGPIPIKTDDDINLSGVKAIDITLAQPSTVGEVVFRNYYTATIAVLVLNDPKVKSRVGRGTPWACSVAQKILMPNPHLEPGSHDTFSIIPSESSIPWDDISVMRLILRQPSPIWQTFKIEEIVMEGFELRTKTVSNKGASYDLVTEYDKKTEVFLIDTLSKNFPDHKFMGEETMAHVKLTDSPTWIIDPIDGTTNFVHGLPFFAIALGLTVEKEVVLGVVCCPSLDQTFHAIKGQGAFLSGKPIHTSGVQEMWNAVIGQEHSLAVKPHLTDLYLKKYRKVVSQAQGIRDLGSAEVSLCQVALGTIDAYEVDCVSPWDIAAGSIIVTEAGGSVLDLNGGKFNCERGCIIAASSKQLAESLAEIINSD